MKNKNLVSIFSVAGGVLFILLYNVLSRMGLFVQSYNYTATGFLGQAVDMMFREFLVFILGVYIGCIVPWFFSKEEKEFIPFLVAIGTVLGTIFGFIVNSFISMLTYRLFARVPILSMGLSWIIIIVGAFLGGRFACARETKKSPLFGRRLLIAIIGIVIFGSPLLLTVKRGDFPGENASISVRHEWAIKKFKIFYTGAIEYLKSSDFLREKIGEITEIAPTIGHNSVGSGPGEVLGHFTLEVVGNKGRAIANVEFIHFSNKSEFSGDFTCNNKFMKLENKTENHTENK